jgi:hypothetical protein
MGGLGYRFVKIMMTLKSHPSGFTDLSVLCKRFEYRRFEPHAQVQIHYGDQSLSKGRGALSQNFALHPLAIRNSILKGFSAKNSMQSGSVLPE